MVKIGVGKDDVIIMLDAKEKLLAISRKITIPKKSIDYILTERAKSSWLSFKTGTHMPKGFMARTFGTRKGKAFYYVKDFSKCITLHLKDHEYSSKVVIQVDDKEAMAKELEKGL